MLKRQSVLLLLVAAILFPLSSTNAEKPADREILMTAGDISRPYECLYDQIWLETVETSSPYLDTKTIWSASYEQLRRRINKEINDNQADALIYMNVEYIALELSAEKRSPNTNVDIGLIKIYGTIVKYKK